MFDKIEQAKLEELHFRCDPETGLHAIIAIHNTRLGPALGGCRFIEYISDDAAITDAIRLARGMSYKAALASLPLGGGKAVIIKPSSVANRADLYRAFGQFVDSLGGRYITAVDSGSHISDMDEVARVTPFVSGTSSDGAAPSGITALGVYAGIESAVRYVLKRSDLRGLRIAIQGVGNVGYALAALLHEAGAQLIVSDTDTDRVKRCVKDFDAEPVSGDSIFAADCEVFAPCALGGALNADTIPRLRCSIVAGAANNQLADDQQGELLHRLGIVYAPDYVINAGGLIQVAQGFLKMPEEVVRQRTLGIGDTLTTLFERSRSDNRPPEQIANQMAEEILYDQARPRAVSASY